MTSGNSGNMPHGATEFRLPSGQESISIVPPRGQMLATERNHYGWGLDTHAG